MITRGQIRPAGGLRRGVVVGSRLVYHGIVNNTWPCCHSIRYQYAVSGCHAARTSGAAKAGVPTMVCAKPTDELSCRETPKSAILTEPWLVSSTLPPLRSRWMMFLLCRNSRPASE